MKNVINTAAVTLVSVNINFPPGIKLLQHTVHGLCIL